MHNLLEKIFETKQFTNSKGEIVPIHSETPAAQCAFLQEIIRENGFKHSIEIGIAYGMSTLAITEAIRENGGKAVALDPFQYSGWGGNGIDLIKQAGYEQTLEFVEDYSYMILPRFIEQGRQFDFAYIDTTKLLDHLMVDFFYLNKLLKTGGIIVFDDVTFPAIRKLLRYLSQLPSYEVYQAHPFNTKPLSTRKKLARKLVPLFALKEEVRITDYALGINAHCVALRKKSEDSRHYDWHTPF